MDSRSILYSAGNKDEYYTPRYAVEPIVEYLKTKNVLATLGFPRNVLVTLGFPRSVVRKPVIWCPFDTEESEYVKVLTEEGYEVIHSHISEGKDFYEYEPENWDIIISNPPFTKKRQIFERALSFNKPFALLAPMTWLNDSAPKQLFRERELELLLFEKRVHFSQPNGTVDKRTTFSSGYYCWDFLPKQIVMGRW
jgi:hypothetical protein